MAVAIQNAARNAALAVTLVIGLTKGAEGIRNYAYLDPVGVPTVCMGHTAGVKLGDYKTDAECEALLGKELYAAVVTVQKCVPHPLEPHVLGAFADAVYNIGSKIACDTKNSTAARLLRAGDITGACNQLPRWNKARVMGVLIPLPGLTRRREDERQLCLGNTV